VICRGCGEDRGFLETSGRCVPCEDSGKPKPFVPKPRVNTVWWACRCCGTVKPRDQYPDSRGISSARRGICVECLPSLGRYQKHPELRVP